ncbi:hypothetical protein A7X12_19050 [Sphingomonas sp. TDK1]|nr:hypothetical protein A7X12_19050 [Sphingomonas sp. TDK1]
MGGIAASLWCLAAGPAAAEVTVTLPASTTPALGEIVAGTMPTVFRIGVDGSVTRISGDAVRLSNAPVTPPTMRLTCGLLNLASLCLVRNIRITMAPQVSGTIASVTMFRVGAVTGTSFSGGPPADASTLNFQLNPMGLGNVVTIQFGMDITVAAGQRGVATTRYTVNADFV